MRRGSPEPWKAAGPEVRAANGQQVALMYGQIEDLVDRRERVIACVNACAGISTELLKQGALEALCQAAEIAVAAAPQNGVEEPFERRLVEAALAGRRALAEQAAAAPHATG